MMKIGFLASHNGSTARAITQACLGGVIHAAPALLISNNNGSNAVAWAKELRLKTAVINAANTSDPDAAIAGLFEDNGIDLVICSGYMKLIGPKTLGSVHGGILNVHPALLPKHGGKGMYGRHVHQAVFDAGEKETGITIHLVDGEYDHGRVIAQKTLPIAAGAGVDDIETMVKEAEPGFYIETIEKILSGDIRLG